MSNVAKQCVVAPSIEILMYPLMRQPEASSEEAASAPTATGSHGLWPRSVQLIPGGSGSVDRSVVKPCVRGQISVCVHRRRFRGCLGLEGVHDLVCDEAAQACCLQSPPCSLLLLLLPTHLPPFGCLSLSGNRLPWAAEAALAATGHVYWSSARGWAPLVTGLTPPTAGCLPLLGA